MFFTALLTQISHIIFFLNFLKIFLQQKISFFKAGYILKALSYQYHITN